MHRRYVILFLLLLCIGTSIAIQQSPAIAQQKNCPGAPPSRLTVGGFGQVTITPAGQVAVPVRVRDAAGRGGRVIGQITDGTSFQVKEGPVCKDGFAWWHIATESIDGWVAEGDANGYYVEPTEGANQGSAASTPKPQTGPTPILAPVPAGAQKDLRFAEFKPGQVDTSGSLAPYQIAQDIGNVVVANALTPDQLSFIQRNGFVVSPGSELEFYTVYEKGRY